jgi:hypothetical protein
VQFTIGGVIHTTPDKRDRIGIRSVCAEPGGCKVDYMLTPRVDDARRHPGALPG